MVWVEDNICTYRYGEILHASAVLLKQETDYGSVHREQVLMLPMPTLPTAVSNLTAELISVQQIRTVMLFMLITVGK